MRRIALKISVYTSTVESKRPEYELQSCLPQIWRCLDCGIPMVTPSHLTLHKVSDIINKLLDEGGRSEPTVLRFILR